MASIKISLLIVDIIPLSVLDFQETIGNMRKKVIMRYVKMGGCQYLRDYRMAQRLKKTAELRKRVMERNKKLTQKNDQIPFQVRFNKLTSVFYASVPLLIVNFVITLSK